MLGIKRSQPETSSIWSALLTCQQEGAMDIKACEKNISHHFPTHISQKARLYPCMFFKPNQSIWGFSFEKLQRARTKPEGFHMLQEALQEINTLRVNSWGLNHLYPSVCYWESPLHSIFIFWECTFTVHTDSSTIKHLLYLINPAAVMLMAASGFALPVASFLSLVIQHISISWLYLLQRKYF